MKRVALKLPLRSETLRQLTGGELRRVVGGSIVVIFESLHPACQSAACASRACPSWTCPEPVTIVTDAATVASETA